MDGKRMLRHSLRIAMWVLACAVPASRTFAQQVATGTDAAARAAARVTVRIDRLPLREALNAIAKAARLEPVYSSKALASWDARITLHASDEAAVAVFERALQGTGLAATIQASGYVVFAPIGASDAGGTLQGTGTITGRVTDSTTGNGIVGATVAVQGSSLSVITRQSGQFTILNVPVGKQTLTVKVLGYASASRPVDVTSGQPAVVRVILRQTMHVLSGVVTTATGTQLRREVGNNIVVLNVDSILQTAPIMTVTDLIEGRVPGVTVQRTSGSPGDPARIRMRGTSSINQNSDPIIIVDGIRMYSRQSDERNITTSGDRQYASPAALDLIDVNTIERMEFLLGPSAASMYGSDAANGVIVVTTKRAQPGRPVSTNVTLNTGMSSMPGEWPVVTYRFGTSLLGGPPIVCVSFCGNAGIDSVVRFQALNDARLTALGRASNYGGNATIRGSVQQMGYTFGANASTEEGVLKLPAIEEERYLRFQGVPAPEWMRHPDRYEKRGFYGNVNIPVTPTMTLLAGTRLDNGVQRRTSMSSANGVNSLRPNIGNAIAVLQQTYADLSQLTEKPMLGNPYERVIADKTAIQNNVQLQVSRWPWLPLTASIGTYALTENTEMTVAPGLTLDADSAGTVRGLTKTTKKITAGLTTLRPIRLHRVISLRAGINFNQDREADLKGSFSGFAPGVTDPATGLLVAANTFEKGSSESQSFGWFLAPQLNLSDRFFFQPGFRLDNNGLSGENARFNALPKMEVSWVAIDRQDGDAPLFGVVSVLRPRLALGVSGVPPNATDQLRLFKQEDGNPLGGSEPMYGTILSLETLGNTRIRPERATELEGGFDVQFPSGRGSLLVTGSRKFRKDAIVDNNYATSVYGGGETKMNVGDIRNTSMEAELNFVLLPYRAIDLSFAANFSRYRSKVVRLSADGAALQLGEKLGGSTYVVGYPVEGVWDRPILGYDDVDGNGWLRVGEVLVGTTPVYIGSQQPKYTADISPTLSLFNRRVRLTTQFSYVSGQMQSLNPNGSSLTSPLRNGGLSPFYGSVVQGPDGFDRQIAVLGLLGLLRAGPPGTLVLAGMQQKVNVLRLQSMSLQLNLGNRGAQLFRAKTASLDVQGSNLGLWTNYIGVDPNVNGILGGRGSLDIGGLPQSRLWQLRLNLGY